MKKFNTTTISLYAALAVLVAAPIIAGETNSTIPFGGYLENGRGGSYGAKCTIASMDEARMVVEGFLTGHDLRIGAMEEHPLFFRAELIDRFGTVKDVVIVNKVNSRVRSAY